MAAGRGGGGSSMEDVSVFRRSMHNVARHCTSHAILL